MRGKQDFQTLYPTSDPNYRPDINEQILFFTVENGNKGFWQFAVHLASLYARETENHAE